MAENFRSIYPFFAAVALVAPGVVAAPRGSLPAPPPSTHTIAVARDLPAYALPAEGDAREVLLYLPGHCGDPFAGLRSFPGAARRVGTLLVVTGDKPCRDRPGRHSWSTDAAQIQARVDAAVAAASAQLERPLEAQALTLMGYSLGALRAELLAGAFPARYPRVILGGGPRTPSPRSFSSSQRVVTLAGQLDAQQPMREGAAALARVGVPARFMLLPRARHGQYGPEGERVLGEAFSWLFSASP